MKQSKKEAVQKLQKAIIFRVSEDEKVSYKAKAKELGITLTELIHKSLKNVSVTNRNNEIELFKLLSLLTKEMNMIGKNINQVTVAIHQIKNSEKMQLDEYERFNLLLQEYISKRDELKEVIYKAMFK